MFRNPFRILTWLFVAVLIVANQACSPLKKSAANAKVQIVQEVKMTTTESLTPLAPTSTIQESSPTATPTNFVANTVPSQAPSVVMITAVNGNLAIRSGPDPVFDAISVLPDGKSVPALARSVLDGWVQVSIPSQPGKRGWVSTKTTYSVITGNVLDLPEIMTVEWPFGSYLQNCTVHSMLVQPGNKVVPSISASPANRVWFYPGSYSIYDLDVSGHPWVMSINLWQHIEFHILKDGTRQQWNCR